MKRTVEVALMVAIVVGLLGCAHVDLANTPDPTVDGPEETAKYTPDDISDELRIDIAEALISLGITEYEIAETGRELEDSDNRSDGYTFDYVIRAGDVELVARGRGSVTKHTGEARASLAYVARSDNKIVWASISVDLYDWKTGELKQ